MTYLASGAIVAMIGLGGGGLAYAASSGGPSSPAHVPSVRLVRLQPGGPVLFTGSDCGKCPTLTLVRGVKAPKVTATETPVPAKGKPVVCSGGTTQGR
jgi:hypothetical protein